MARKGKASNGKKRQGKQWQEKARQAMARKGKASRASKGKLATKQRLLQPEFRFRRTNGRFRKREASTKDWLIGSCLVCHRLKKFLGAGLTRWARGTHLIFLRAVETSGGCLASCSMSFFRAGCASWTRAWDAFKARVALATP